MDLFSLGSHGYPGRLAALPHPPPVVFVSGRVPPERGVAVVGTRKASAAGLAFARTLGRELCRSGFVVWSGGAAGIDRAVHEGALEAGGPTVLVAGGGLAHLYPKDAGPLWERVQRNGAVVAIVPPDEPPRPATFLRRNAVLAACTEAMVLVECPLDSGARNATSHARKLGRAVHVVGQAPWSPFAATVEVETRLGARPFFTVAELTGRLGGAAKPAPPRADPREQALVDALAGGPKHLDDLCETLGLGAADVQVRLLRLELEGRAARDERGLWMLLGG